LKLNLPEVLGQVAPLEAVHVSRQTFEMEAIALHIELRVAVAALLDASCTTEINARRNMQALRKSAWRAILGPCIESVSKPLGPSWSRRAGLDRSTALPFAHRRP
jgi:hypothetical protein